MNRQQIVEKVNNLMANEFEIPREQLTPEAHIVQDLKLDSLDAVDMLVYLEEQCGTKLNVERFKEVRTLGQIYDLIEQMQSELGKNNS